MSYFYMCPYCGKQHAIKPSVCNLCKRATDMAAMPTANIPQATLAYTPEATLAYTTEQPGESNPGDTAPPPAH